MPYLAKGYRPDINNGPGVTRIVPTFWPQHLFKLNLNNGPSPSLSKLGSDGRYTLFRSPTMDSWWVPCLHKGCRPDFNNGLGDDSNSGFVLATQRLFEFDSNNGSFPSHSNLVSDGVYTCLCLIPMVSWWVPYLHKGCRPDFNNGLGCDANSGPVLVPGVYLSPTRIMAPPRATPILCQMKSRYLFKSPIYDFLVVTMTSTLT